MATLLLLFPHRINRARISRSFVIPRRRRRRCRNFIRPSCKREDRVPALSRAFRNLVRGDPPPGDPSRLRGPADSAARREESSPYLRRPVDVLQLNPSKAARSVQRLPLPLLPPFLLPAPLLSATILRHLDRSLYSFLWILAYANDTRLICDKIAVRQNLIDVIARGICVCNIN